MRGLIVVELVEGVRFAKVIEEFLFGLLEIGDVGDIAERERPGLGFLRRVLGIRVTGAEDQQ